MGDAPHTEPIVIGRYALHGEVAFGGMASVHLGRLRGPVGFSRTVAIKRLHPQFARDPEFVAMFLEEARLAARIHHPNVVQTLDVVALEREAFLVMEYVAGEALSKLARTARTKEGTIDLDVISAIMCGVLHGLHAAHEATDEQGAPLRIVHRDVSPQNVHVGVDGVPRLLDFGVAKAAGRAYTTRSGQLKGKIAYMAPEQLASRSVDRRTDLYAAGVVLWEALALKRLFAGDSEVATISSVLEQNVMPPSAHRSDVPAKLDALVLKALSRDPAARFESARQMALELEAIVPVASATRVAAWVQKLASDALAERAKRVADVESEKTKTEAAARPLPDVASQVSSISVSSSSTPHGVPRRWRTRTALAAGGLLATAMVGVVAIAMRHHVVPTPQPTTLATAAASTSTIPPPPETPLAARSVPVDTTPTKVAPPPSARPREKVVAAPPPSSSVAAAPTASAPCVVTVTSFIDDAGIKHFAQVCK